MVLLRQTIKGESMNKRKDYFEPYVDDLFNDRVIKPQVFGAHSKFGEVNDNSRVEKVEGRYKNVPGEFVTLRATGYWHLINAMLRELRMTNRDRFILEAHLEGKTSRKINSMLDAHDYFKPYKKSAYVNDRIAALIRKYFLTPKSELNSVY
jgi:hypothetical protein